MCRPEVPEWLYEERRRDLDPELHMAADAEQTEAMRIADLLAERPSRPETAEEKSRRQVAEEMTTIESLLQPEDTLFDLDPLSRAINGPTGPDSVAVEEMLHRAIRRAVRRTMQLPTSSDESYDSEDRDENSSSEEEQEEEDRVVFERANPEEDREVSQGANPDDNKGGEEQDQNQEKEEDDDTSHEES